MTAFVFSQFARIYLLILLLFCPLLYFPTSYNLQQFKQQKAKQLNNETL